MKNVSFRTCVHRSGQLLIVFSLSGCASVASLTNPASEPCRTAFRDALDSSLVAQGEASEEAASQAGQYASSTTLFSKGPRPFLVSTRSGADYVFFVDKTRTGCLLRLVQRQKGFVRYSNNLTYIETRALPGCECAE